MLRCCQRSEMFAPNLRSIYAPPPCHLGSGRSPGLHLPRAGCQHHPSGDDCWHQELWPWQSRWQCDQGLGRDTGTIEMLWTVDWTSDQTLDDVEVKQDAEPQLGLPGGARLLLHDGQGLRVRHQQDHGGQHLAGGLHGAQSGVCPGSCAHTGYCKYYSLLLLGKL